MTIVLHIYTNNIFSKFVGSFIASMITIIPTEISKTKLKSTILNDVYKKYPKSIRGIGNKEISCALLPIL